MALLFCKHFGYSFPPLLSSGILGLLKNIEIFFLELGVEISLSKSLVSNNRAFEFEKKFYVNRGLFDYSPVSMRALVEFD